MYLKYKELVDFRFIYTAEAHPGARVQVERDGESAFAVLKQTSSLAERNENAELCANSLQLTIPTLVDHEDNAVTIAYRAFPVGLVVVDREGDIVYKCVAAPDEFRPEEVEGCLMRYIVVEHH